MSVYITNPSKQDENGSVGAWFSLPISPEDVQEKIGLTRMDEPCVIHQYEMPFEIGEFETIERLNRLYHLVQEIGDSAVYEALSDLLKSGYFDNLEDLVRRKDDIRYWHDCRDMADVAWDCIEDGYFGEVPEGIRWCIDYERLGWAMSVNGTFIHTDNGIYELHF